MAVIYRQLVEAMETANVALSPNGGVNRDEASSQHCVVRCPRITNKSCGVVRILHSVLKIRSVRDFISVGVTQ